MINWDEIWEEFEDRFNEEVDEAIQNEMCKKYGENTYYYVDPEKEWEKQKQLIENIIEAKLKEQK